MASGETYNGTPATSVNSVVATSVGLEGAMSMDSGRGVSEDESVVHGATGSSGGGGVEGVNMDEAIADHQCVGSLELIFAVALSAEGEVENLALHLD